MYALTVIKNITRHWQLQQGNSKVIFCVAMKLTADNSNQKVIKLYQIS